MTDEELLKLLAELGVAPVPQTAVPESPKVPFGEMPISGAFNLDEDTPDLDITSTPAGPGASMIGEDQSLPSLDSMGQVILDEASLSKTTDDGSLDFLSPEGQPKVVAKGVSIKTPEYLARSQVKPMRLKTDEELAQHINPDDPQFDNAMNERALRKRWESQSFWENLRDPDYAAREADRLKTAFTMGGARLPEQLLGLATLPVAAGEYGLRKMGIPTEDASLTERLLQEQAEWHEKTNKAFGTSSPQNPVESLAEIAGGAFPLTGPLKAGGATKFLEYATPLTFGGAKAVAPNIGLQFLGSEAFRGGLGNEHDPYETIFHGFSSKAEAQSRDPDLDFVVGTTPDGAKLRDSDLLKLGAVGLATVGIGATPALVRNFWPKKPIPYSSVIDDTGITAPQKLENPVTGGDHLKAYLLGPDSFVFGLMRRSGIDNRDLYDEVEMNSWAAQNSKIKAAVETGEMRTMDGDYVTPHSAARLQAAYDGLTKTKQQLVDEHAGYLDLLDHMNAQKVNTLEGLDKADVIQRIRDIEQISPEAVQLNKVNRSLNTARIDFAASGKYAIFTRAEAAALKRNHANNIPYEKELIDPDAPLAERATQRAYLQGEPDTQRTQFFGERPPVESRTPAYMNIQHGTEAIIRAKMNNAVRGTVIDTIRKSPFGKKWVVKADPKNKNFGKWRKAGRIIQLKRKGKTEYYAANKLLVDILKLDPHITRHPWVFGAARTFQMFTTGALRPQFALKQFLRDSQLIPLNTPAGLLKLNTIGDRYFGEDLGYLGVPIPGLGVGRSALSVFEQLGRQTQIGLANMLYKSLDSGSGKILRAAFGNNENFMRGLADMAAHSYMRSTFHAITSGGGFDINMMHNPIKQTEYAFTEALKSLDNVAGDAVGKGYTIPKNMVAGGWKGWKNILAALQNGPRYALGARNYRAKTRRGGLTKTNLDTLIKQVRHITGELSNAGISWGRDGKVIGGDFAKPNILHQVLPSIANVAEWARTGSPWTNAIIQDMRTIGKAYWRNPWRFQMRMYTSVMMPAAYSFFWAQSLGPEYSDYMMEQRSEYDKSNTLYIAIPGKKPEDGIEIPLPLSIAPLHYMLLNNLDYVFRGGGAENGTVAKTILNNYFGLTTPPILQAFSGLQGQKLPSSMPGFGEEAYTPAEDPYGYLDSNVELSLRALMASSFDMYVGAISSFLEEGDIDAGVDELLYQFKKGVPVLADKQLSSYNALNQEGLAFARKVDQLNKIYSTHIGSPGLVKQNPSKDIYVDPLKRGEGDEVLIPGESNIRAGMAPVPPPTNPVYIMFAHKLYDRFEKNGDQFLDMTSNLATITKQVKSLKLVNSGRLPTWKQQVLDMPNIITKEVKVQGYKKDGTPKKRMDTKAVELENPIKAQIMKYDLDDRDTPRKLINEFEKRRMVLVKRIKLYIKETEDQINKEMEGLPDDDPIKQSLKGKRIKLDELDPYEQPSEFPLQ